MAEVQDFELEDVGEIEAVVEQQQQQQEQVKESQSSDEDIPPEFRGKSVAELARIAKHARGEMGRQANELGEVRKLADELLRSSLVKKPEPEAVKEVDFFENPEQAVRNAVDNHPKVLAAEQVAQQMRMTQAKQALVNKHPDFSNIVQDSEFAQWVGASKVRSRLFQAAEAYDVEAADELLSTFKELRSMKQAQTAKVDTKARDAALKSAAVETGGSGESSKKVYRRADLIRLKMNNPSKYEDMSDEIMRAYQEGRVR